MDSLEDKMGQLNLINNGGLPGRAHFNEVAGGKVSALVSSFNESSELYAAGKKIAPSVPPKPFKKPHDFPEVPQSSLVKKALEPRYSQRLEYGLESPKDALSPSGGHVLQRKQPMYATTKSLMGDACKVTLDNPAVLEQQLEALTHHKKQLEMQKLLGQQEPKKPLSKISTIPKLSSTSLLSDGHANIYSNLPTPSSVQDLNVDVTRRNNGSTPSEYVSNSLYKNKPDANALYTNSPQSVYSSIGGYYETRSIGLSHDNDDDVPSPPSPVSSSYSELRRATDVFNKKPNMPSYPNSAHNNYQHYGILNTDNAAAKAAQNMQQTYSNVNTYGNDFGIYSPTMQGSSTYESIYEPINPRPPSQLSSRSNFTSYNSYVNELPLDKSSDDTLSLISSNSNMQLFPGSNASTLARGGGMSNSSSFKKENEVNELTDYLVHSMDEKVNADPDSYGICFKCNEPVFGENSGCTAMEHIYHISCFTCSQCQINLQGKPFYALEGNPYCEYDYLQTLEKCSVCMQPILERILRATGKPYHPQCFTCVVCNRSLDGIPFTVDATNQNYCIADFHKKFAPRCCVCKEPIMPEPGEEETVRVVALDRSFHFECYKCEDCGLLLSSEAEGRGCYPLDDHVLCKSCNAKRVQLLTNHIE